MQATTDMIRLEELTLGYGQRILLEKVSATFAAGQLTALLGRNGTGKSTLLRAVSGLETRTREKHRLSMEQKILLQGIPLAQIPQHQRAATIAVVTTERVRISNLSCKDIVALGRAPYTNWIGSMQKEDEAIVMQSLEQVGMASYANRSIDTLSDGESQRIMIARALAQTTPIILLDEPTSFLDIPNRYELCNLLARLAHQENKCILFSTHELDIATSLCDSIALIDTPNLYHLPAAAMQKSGHLDRLFTRKPIL